MKKMLVVALFVAACGGGSKKKPVQPDMANTGSAAETKTEPTGPSDADNAQVYRFFEWCLKDEL